jgi:hypothetical protein
MGRYDPREGVPKPCTHVYPEWVHFFPPTTSPNRLRPVRSTGGLPRRLILHRGAQVTRAHQRAKGRVTALGTGLLIVLSGLAPPARAPGSRRPSVVPRLNLSPTAPHARAVAGPHPSPLFWGPISETSPPIRGRWAPLPRADSASPGMPRQTVANAGFVRVNPCPATRENARPARSEQGNAHTDTAGRSGKPSALVPPEPEPQRKERSERNNDDTPANWSGR